MEMSQPCVSPAPQENLPESASSQQVHSSTQDSPPQPTIDGDAKDEDAEPRENLPESIISDHLRLF